MNATTASAATTNIGQSLTPQMAKKGILQGNTTTQASQGNSGGGGGSVSVVGAGGVNSGGVLTPGGHHDQQASTPMSGKRLIFSFSHA